MKKTELKQLIIEQLQSIINEGKKLTDDDFYKKYTPEFNKIEMKSKPKEIALEDMCSWGGCMYDTFGEELKYVQSQPEENTWTIIEGDNDKMYITPGFHAVNKMGFLITKEPWTDKNEEYIAD